MRGFSLLVIAAGVLFVGYLFQRSTEEAAYTDTGDPTTKHVERQVEDILQQYQKKLDRQAADN